MAGFGSPPPGELAPQFKAQLRQLLRETASNYLTAGGQVTPSLWLNLDRTERAALTAAGLRLNVDQAIRIGTAAQGDLAALRVRAEIDGGEAHDNAMLRAAVAGLSEEMKGVRSAS